MEWRPALGDSRAWHLPERIAFRFGFLVALLFVVPFPLGVIPGTSRFAWLVHESWCAAVSWFATVVLGIEDPSRIPTGSGDTTWAFVQLLMIAIIAVIGTAVWSIGDRRRTSYARLAAATIVVLRYYVALFLIAYGFAKIFNTQFPEPSPIRLDQRTGDMSPMGMLWTFMGSAQPYAIASGIAEALAGVLLLWRRTTVIGGVLGLAVMTNIVLLNFSYDVPVKLLSLRLLAFLVAILLPHAPRMLRAAFGRSVPEVARVPRISVGRERARLAIKLVLVGSIAYSVYAQVTRRNLYVLPKNELHGIWTVDRMSIDGIERPPLTTDGERWRKLAVARGYLGIRWMTDERQYFRAAQIEDGEIRLTIDDQPQTWRYTLHDGDPVTLAIEGTLRGVRIDATLVREPEPLLVTRGFHWIQDAPFNR